MTSAPVLRAAAAVRLRRLHARLDPVCAVIVSGVVLVALICAFVAMAVKGGQEIAVAAEMRENANLARALAEHVERAIRSADHSVQMLKLLAERKGDGLDLLRESGVGRGENALVVQASVADETGQVTGSTLAMRSANVSDREHFRVHAASDTGQPFISKPVLGRVSGKWSIQIVRRVNRPDGAFGGIAVVSIDPFYFTRFYRKVDLGRRGMVTIAGRDGIVRARQAGGAEQLGDDMVAVELLAHIGEAGSGSYLTTRGEDGVRRVASYHALADYPLVVEVASGVDDALADFEPHRRGYLAGGAIAIALILCMTALLATLVARQQRAAVRLREARRVAETANRMKSEFLANMSHELRTPLNGILGFAEVLRDESAEGAHRQCARHILTSGARLLELVNSLLDLAKIEAGRMELAYTWERTADFLDEAVAPHRIAAQRKGLGFEMQVAPDLPQTLACDRTRLLQVLGNLLHNAVKFTEQGGVRLAVTRADRTLHFEVADTGRGVAPEARELVFERFRQEDASVTRSHAGTGLGLALARELVELMGGRITLEPNPTGGSIFRFSLPLPEAIG